MHQRLANSRRNFNRINADWVVRPTPEQVKTCFKPGQWNEMIVAAEGRHVVVQVNGHKTAELADDPGRGEGHLALQLHGGQNMHVEFKDIRVMHIPDVCGEAKLLFNGKNLDGWTLSSDRLKDTWSVKDGVLVNEGRPVGYIRTKADYTNYVLRLQFRHLGRGNGGVLLRMVGPDKVWPRSIEAQGQYNSAGDIWNIDKFPMKTDPEPAVDWEGVLCVSGIGEAFHDKGDEQGLDVVVCDAYDRTDIHGPSGGGSRLGGHRW